MIDLIKKRISESINIKQDILGDRDLLDKLKKSADVIIDSYRNGGKVFFCGNGGSAADSQHLAAELVFKFYLDRKSLPAEALNVNTSIISAVSNDLSYEQIFARQLEANGRKGDVLVGLSTSGSSQNVVNAIKKGQEMGIFTIGFTGSAGGPVDKASDLCFKVPSEDTPRIQEVHILLGHILCEIVEAELFGGD